MFDISCCLILSLLPAGPTVVLVLVSPLTGFIWEVEAVEPVRAEISDQ